MKKKDIKNSYDPGIVGTLLDRIAKFFGLDPVYLRAIVYKAYPQFKDKTRCPNCNASMAIYNFSIDYLVATLVHEMGGQVKEKIKKGLPFHLANQVHVQSQIKASYAIKSRTTWAAKLGLIAKVVKRLPNGELTHDTKAGWLITKRGYSFLRNEPVPKRVSVFRNEIREHQNEVITFQEAINNGPAMKGEGYNPHDWVDIENYAQGILL